MQPSGDKVSTGRVKAQQRLYCILNISSILSISAPFVFVHAVDVCVHCECHGVVAEDGSELIHAALQRTGGEGVAQGVEGKVPDVGIFNR